jgi:ABC-type lipoprotein release transport system permease subunit
MIFVLIAYGVVALIVFLVAWRGFDAELGTALTVAVVGTGVLTAITYVLANMGRLM